MAAEDRSRAQELVKDLFGPGDRTADRAVAVLHAHATALAFVRDATGEYPAPAPVAAALDEAARRLRDGDDDGDPVTILGQAAVTALAGYRAGGDA